MKKKACERRCVAKFIEIQTARTATKLEKTENNRSKHYKKVLIIQRIRLKGIEIVLLKLVRLTVLESSFLFVTFDIMLGRHSISFT